jgi:hypothetical protein
MENFTHLLLYIYMVQCNLNLTHLLSYNYMMCIYLNLKAMQVKKVGGALIKSLNTLCVIWE